LKKKDSQRRSSWTYKIGEYDVGARGVFLKELGNGDHCEGLKGEEGERKSRWSLKAESVFEGRFTFLGVRVSRKTYFGQPRAYR
jgi:hypothetical protein